MQTINFPAAAAELRQQEFSRLSAAVTPRIEAFRSMTGDAFRTEIAQMLERLGHTVISSVSDIVTTKERRKYVTACATPTDDAPIKTPALRRLHDAIVAGNAARGFYVTPRGFTPEAEHFCPARPSTTSFASSNVDGVWEAIWAEPHMALRERMAGRPAPRLRFSTANRSSRRKRPQNPCPGRQ